MPVSRARGPAEAMRARARVTKDALLNMMRGLSGVREVAVFGERSC
jgi:hypothetical protein